MLRNKSGLTGSPDFIKLWLGETISLFGSQITVVALPFTAILVLNASPAQMGFLGAAEFAPLLLVSLFAGVWVDRLPRRKVMIASDLGQALLLLLIPLTAWLGLLTMELLYLLAFLTGTLAVFFAIAYQSYLPSLVARDDLPEGNSKLEASQAVAEISGPALGGILVQVLGAPLALVLDACSFLASAFSLSLIRQPEPPPTSIETRPGLWTAIGAGLKELVRHALLRAFALCNACSNFFGAVIGTVYTLYLLQDLKIGPAVVGLILTAGGLGGVLGAILAARVTRWLGLGRSIILASLISGLAWWLVPLAAAPLALALPLLVANRLLFGLLNPVYRITQLSVRQAVTAPGLQGRVNASMRFLAGGVVPLGALTGGWLGTVLGLRPTLVIGAAGMSLAFLALYFSPVRKLGHDFDLAR
ncbi:MAG: Major facilitator superfamily 1 [Chloroflexi bacterium]|nr:Major facilitator superfamily 1 [Chloroflexota bacterium]